MNKHQKEIKSVRHTTELNSELLTNVRHSIVIIRNLPVITDADVANLYGVETKRINEAVRNNPDKFPEGYYVCLVFRGIKCFAVEIFVHKTFFQKQGASKGLYREGIVYAGYNLEE